MQLERTMTSGIGITQAQAFVEVAERSSFAKAAQHLGISRSALSSTVRTLEDALGVRLLNRNTRSVAMTEAGERMLAQLRPAIENFQAALESASAYRDKPAGTLRLTVPRPAAKALIEPMLGKFLSDHPAVTLEISVGSGLSDIVRDRFDAGIRPGHRLEQDMVAVRVGDDARATIVASPKYIARHAPIKKPADLQSHNCARMRFASGVIQPWVFEKARQTIEVAVTGTLITSDGDLAIRAALDGAAVARVPEAFVRPMISRGQLVELLHDWQPASVGFYLYYPHRRHPTPALQAFIAALKMQMQR
jgi:DNA-binding transcriptional LysR family regulator